MRAAPKGPEVPGRGTRLTLSPDGDLGLWGPSVPETVPFKYIPHTVPFKYIPHPSVASGPAKPRRLGSVVSGQPRIWGPLPQASASPPQGVHHPPFLAPIQPQAQNNPQVLNPLTLQFTPCSLLNKTPTLYSGLNA